MLKEIVAVTNLLSIVIIAVIFIQTIGTSCFNIGQWYMSVIPLAVSLIAQLIAIIIKEEV